MQIPPAGRPQRPATTATAAAASGRRPLLATLAATLAAGCSPAAWLNGLAPARRVARDIPYGDGKRRTLDVYAPLDAGPRGVSASDPSGASPVLVFLYGGSWDSGSKALYRFLGSAYAGVGYVVVIPDYRLYPEVRYPDFLDDNAAALAWTIAHAPAFGGDVSRGVHLMGHSAGAYDAAMLTLDPTILARQGMAVSETIRDTVGLAGPYDFLPFDTEIVRAVFATAPDPRQTQPIDHVTGTEPPMMLATGRDDTVVRPSNTRNLARRIRARGGVVVEHSYPGIGHRELVGAIAPSLRILAPVFEDSLVFMRG